ncbi:hypothetical protein HER39_17580, partial [Arthrobacter deserti]|nr:hypothetical protein [Arthrobacter deserti]
MAADMRGGSMGVIGALKGLPGEARTLVLNLGLSLLAVAGCFLVLSAATTVIALVGTAIAALPFLAILW